ncbi:MAG: SpoIIE family protein phosphatase [Armatimonadota bacterium]|nr:SpoIIE family protein phosphatase [Armatimonadota bacterium]
MAPIGRQALREAVDSARLRILIAASNSAQSTDEMIQIVLDQIESVTGSEISFYHFVEADQKTLSLQTWSSNTLKNMCTAEGKGRHYPIAEAGVWVDCVKKRRPVIHNSYASLPHRKGLPEGHAPVIRELVVPIIRSDKIMALIGVGNKPDEYDQADIETVSFLGELSWEMVERLRLHEELRQSEFRYRSLFENMLDGLAHCRMIYEDGIPTDFVYLTVNNSFVTLTGLKNAAGKKASELIPGIRKSNPELLEIYGRVAITGNPERFETHVKALARWFNVSVFSPSREHFVAIFDDITDRKRAEDQLVKKEQRSRNIATALQDALLPDVPTRDDVEIGLSYRGASTAARLGGDFYDFIELSEGRLAVVIGDVCGKGLGAAKSTAMVKYTLRAYIKDCRDPGACLTRLNRTLADQIDMEKFVTIGLAVLDTSAGSVRYASAGHPPPIFINNDAETMELEQGVPLGVIADYEYVTVNKTVAAEEKFALYTDGLIDARPKDGEPFGRKLLMPEINSGRDLGAHELCQRLVDSAVSYSGNAVKDDIAVIVIKIKKGLHGSIDRA